MAEGDKPEEKPKAKEDTPAEPDWLKSLVDPDRDKARAKIDGDKDKEKDKEKDDKKGSGDGKKGADPDSLLNKASRENKARINESAGAVVPPVFLDGLPDTQAKPGDKAAKNKEKVKDSDQVPPPGSAAADSASAKTITLKGEHPQFGESIQKIDPASGKVESSFKDPKSPFESISYTPGPPAKSEAKFRADVSEDTKKDLQAKLDKNEISVSESPNGRGRVRADGVSELKPADPNSDFKTIALKIDAKGNLTVDGDKSELSEKAKGKDKEALLKDLKEGKLPLDTTKAGNAEQKVYLGGKVETSYNPPREDGLSKETTSRNASERQYSSGNPPVVRLIEREQKGADGKPGITELESTDARGATIKQVRNPDGHVVTDISGSTAAMKNRPFTHAEFDPKTGETKFSKDGKEVKLDKPEQAIASYTAADGKIKTAYLDGHTDGLKPVEPKALQPPETLTRNSDGSFVGVTEFPPGSEQMRQERKLDANQQLIEQTNFKNDGSSISRRADGTISRTVNSAGEESTYTVDKNKQLTNYSDSEGNWAKQKDGSWKNETNGQTFKSERWLDEKGALHIKAENGEQQSKQLDGAKLKYDKQDRVSEISDRFGTKTLGYKGDEKQPNSIDYGYGKWVATDDAKTKWEKTAPDGKKQNWDGTVQVENGQVSEKYKNETEVIRKSDGAVVTTNKDGDLSEISAGKDKYKVDYAKPGEANKITLPDQSTLEKRADGWYSGNKKQFDSVNIDDQQKTITFKRTDGSSQVVDSSGQKSQFDQHGKLTQIESPDGSKTTINRSSDGKFEGKEVRFADKTTSKFDANNQVVAIDRADGHKIRVERGENGAITKLNDSMGAVSWESKDGGKSFVQGGSDGKVKIESMPTLTAKGEYEFRSADRTLSRHKDGLAVSSSEGKSIHNNDGSSLQVNKAGEVEQASTANGVRLAVKREHDPAKADAPGKVVEAKIGDQVWTRSKEAGKDNQWTSNDGKQRTGEFTLDKDGSMHFKDAVGKGELVHKLDGSILEKDAQQNIRKMTGPDGQSYSFSYDAKGKMNAIQFPDGSSQTRLPDRLDGNNKPVERWAQDGTGKIIDGTRSIDANGTLHLQNAGEKERVVRSDGFEERQGPNGEKLLSRENTDKSSVTKNELGQMVETKTADGQVRKYGYDSAGNMNSVDLGKDGKWKSDDSGKTWSKEGTKPLETKEASFLLTPKGDLVEQRKVDGKNVEDIRKTDGSVLHAENGLYTSQRNALQQEYKIGYNDKHQPNRFEDPKDKGAYWTSADNKTWVKHAADGKPDPNSKPEKFTVGFDPQGNLLKKNLDASTLERMGTDGSSTIAAADGRKLSEHKPDGSGKFVDTSYQYDKDNKFTGKETKSADGLVEKSDALGRVTDVSKGQFHRSFAYENSKYPNLVTSFNDNGNKYAIDQALLAKDQVVYRNQDPNKAGDQRSGLFTVEKDGGMSMRSGNFELTDRLDGSKLVRRDDGSMLDYRADGRLNSTRDVNGFLISYQYDMPRDILGRPGQLSAVTYGEGANASTYRTSDGFRWRQDGTGKEWKGFTSLNQQDGTLTDKNYYGSVSERGLDGKVVQRPDKSVNIGSATSEIQKTMDYWYNSNAIVDIRNQFHGKTAEEIQMMKEVYHEQNPGHGLWGDLYKRFDEGSDTHRWAEVQGYLNKKDRAGEDSAIQLAVDSQEIGRWWWNRDRSKSEILESTRHVLGNATEAERKSYADAYQNLYNKDFQSLYKEGGAGNTIRTWDKYHETLIGTALEKGKDLRTPQEEAAILSASLKSGNKLDYFMEASGGIVKQSGREEFLAKGGRDQIREAFTETHATEGGSYTSTDEWRVQQATDFAETGALRPHTAIRKAGGVFSNDDNVIEHTLEKLTPEQRAQFIDGQRISKLPEAERQNLNGKEKESQEFYSKMMDSFKSLHYFGAEKKAEKYIDQTLHKGGTDVADKVAPIGGHWTNSNQVNAQAIESMDQRTFNTLMSGTRGSLDQNGAVHDGIAGDGGKQYLSEFHKQMAGALSKNLGSGEYVERAQALLDQKIKEGVSINAAADSGNLAALRDKVPQLKNIPDEKFTELSAGHDLQKKINSGEIKEGDLTKAQATQLEAYKKDTVLRPFMEGREVAKQLNDIESGARAERLFAGRDLEQRLSAAGQAPNAEQQKQIDFFKQNAKEIEGLTKNLTGQVIERQKDSFTKQLSKEASESLQSYQKTLYDAVKQNTGRDILQTLKDNEGFWSNDRKAMLDGVLSLNAATREKIKNDPNGYGKELRAELEKKFSHDSKDNAQYRLMDSLLKQIETSDKKVPDAPVMGAKEQLLAQAAGIDGYKNKDAVAIISENLKADKDGSIAAKLAADPEFRKAALESMHGNEAAYERQIKPLLESGRLPTDELKERHTHIESSGEGDTGHPVFDPKGFLKEGVLDASPKALKFLNSAEGAAEREKVLSALSGDPKLQKMAEEIIKQGEVKDEDRIRAFVLGAGGTSKEQALDLMKNMPEAKRMEMEKRYEDKYGDNFRASVLSQVDNKEFNEFFRATRSHDWSTEQAYLHAVKTVASTDAGVGAALARNYNVTHVEALNRFSQVKYEAAAQGKTLDKAAQEEQERGVEDRVKSFKETKASTNDTVVTGVVTVAALAAAPWTAGMSLAALGGTSALVGLGAAGLKYGLQGNDTNGAREVLGDTVKYGTGFLANSLAGGHLGLGEEAGFFTSTLMHASAGGIGNTIGEGGRQLVEEGQLNGEGLKLAAVQGFVFAGIMSSAMTGLGAAGKKMFGAAETTHIATGGPHNTGTPAATAGPHGGAPHLATETVVAAGIAVPATEIAAKIHAPAEAPALHGTSPGAGAAASEELKTVVNKAKAGEPGSAHTAPADNAGGKPVERVSASTTADTLLAKTAVPDQMARSANPHAHYTAGDYKLSVNGQEMPLDKKVVTLGREPGPKGNDLVFTEGTVSGKHAQIEFKDNGPVIKDLGSTNGTTVNGQKIRAGEEVHLKPGDKIKLGPNVEFTFGVKPEFHFEVNGRPLDLPPGGAQIGRSSENNMVIADNAVSRKHASIANTEKGPVVTDLGSKNGTFVNGKQLKPGEPALLKPGDNVQFGKDGPVYKLGKGMENPVELKPQAADALPRRQVMEYKPKPGEATPTANPEAVRESNLYKDKGEIRAPLRDGFQTLSGDARINADGTWNDPHRPGVVVDRTRDKVLNDAIAEAHKRFDHLKGDPEKLAKELTKYSKELMHPKGWSEEMVDASYNTFRNENKGKQILLGDYIDRAGRGEGAGVCQHQALLMKVLGDDFGMDVSLVSGFYGQAPKGGLPKDTFANHAWNEVHIKGKTYIYDPRHEQFGRSAAELPKHNPSRSWLDGPNAKPVGRFENVDLKPGDMVNHEGSQHWQVTTEKPKTPGNVVISSSATRVSPADEIAQLNPEHKKLVVGEKYRLKRSSGDIEEGWQLMGQGKDGNLQFYKADGFKKEVSLKELARENPNIGEIKAAREAEPGTGAKGEETKPKPEETAKPEEKAKPEETSAKPREVKEGEVLPKKTYDAAEVLDTQRIKNISKAFSEGTREVPLSKEQFEGMFKNFNEADRKLALEFMEQSAPNMTPRALDDQLRSLQQKLDGLDKNLRKDGITVFTLKGDDSGEMMAQLLRKNQDQLKINVVQLDEAGIRELRAKGMPERAVVLGDISQASAAQKQILGDVKNLYVSNINGFDNGPNFIDFGASQFSGPKGMEDKLNGLVERAKALQAQEKGLSNQDAVKRILQGDTGEKALAINPNAKVIQPDAALPGRDLRAQVGGNDAYRIGSIYDQLTAPQMTQQQMERYLASIPNKQIQSYTAHILENGVEYKPYTQMMREFHEMHENLMAKLPAGTKPSDILIVSGLEQQAGKALGKEVDNIGSQMVAGKLYARANNLGSENFITTSELAARGPGAANGKVLVYLDDFSLSGRQAAGVMHANAQMLKDSGGKLVVATMGRFETKVDAWNLWKTDPKRYGGLEGLDVTVMSNKVYKNFYSPEYLQSIGLAGQETKLGQFNKFKPGHDSGISTNILTPYGGPNNNLQFLDDLQKQTGLRGNGQYKLKYNLSDASPAPNSVAAADAGKTVAGRPAETRLPKQEALPVDKSAAPGNQAGRPAEAISEAPKGTPVIEADTGGWEYRDQHGKTFQLKDANTPLQVREHVTVYAEAGRQTEFFDQSKGFIKGPDTAAVAHGESQLELRAGATAHADGNAKLNALDNSSVQLKDQASALMKDKSQGVLNDKSSAVLMDKSQAVLKDQSSAVLEGQSQAVLADGSSAVLRDQAIARVQPGTFASPTVKASGDALVTVEAPASKLIRPEPVQLTLSDNARAVLGSNANVTAHGPNASVQVNPGVKDANINLKSGAQARFDNASGVVSGDGVIRVSGDSHIVIDAGDKPVKVIIEGGNPVIEIRNGKNIEFQAVEGSKPTIANPTETSFKMQELSRQGVETGKVSELGAEGKLLADREGRPKVATDPATTMKQVIDDIRRVDPQLASELLNEPMAIVRDMGNAGKDAVRLASADGTGGIMVKNMRDLIANPQKYPKMDLANAEHELAGHRAFDNFLDKNVSSSADKARLAQIRSELLDTNKKLVGTLSKDAHVQYLNSPPELAADLISANGSLSQMKGQIEAVTQAGKTVAPELQDTYNKMLQYRQQLDRAMYKVQMDDPSTRFYFDKAREFSARMHPHAPE